MFTVVSRTPVNMALEVNLTTEANNMAFNTKSFKYHVTNNTNFSNMFADFNISMDVLNDFLEKYVQQISQKKNVTLIECSQYCRGHVRDILLSYRGLHGYISLVVSAIINKVIKEI